MYFTSITQHDIMVSPFTTMFASAHVVFGYIFSMPIYHTNKEMLIDTHHYIIFAQTIQITLHIYCSHYLVLLSSKHKMSTG